MGKNILSIDDDEDILYTIQEIILHQGWTPLLARNFREGRAHSDAVWKWKAGSDPCGLSPASAGAESRLSAV